MFEVVKYTDVIRARRWFIYPSPFLYKLRNYVCVSVYR